MSCPNCGKEILDEDATFCPKCGKSLTSEDEIQQKRTDLVLAAGILTIIAAAFSAGLAYIEFFQYNYAVSYYTSLVPEYDSAPLLGFLILGAFGVVASAFGLAGGIFMLKRKRIKISILGVVLLLASVVVNYVVIQYYQYGFMDILLFSETAIAIFSILSGALVFTSKAEFT